MLKYAVIALAFAASVARAQTTPIVTAVHHAPEKFAASLDWVGEYDQRPEYAEYWAAVAKCADIPLPPAAMLGSVHFYYVNAASFIPVPSDKPDSSQVGVTYGSVQQIYMALPLVKNAQAIGHEMLHQLLFWAGDPRWNDHSNPAFARCDLWPLAK